MGVSLLELGRDGRSAARVAATDYTIPSWVKRNGLHRRGRTDARLPPARCPMGRIGPATGTALLFIVLLAGCQATRSSPAPVTQEPALFQGEPIRLDAPDLDPRYRDYFARLSRMIRDKWSYPCVPNAAT